ncbi:MAG: CsbD family protein [Acidimicrobiia bacterium]
MSNTDDLKGRAKEAAGDLTDNDRLQREGKADQLEGKAKDLVDGVRDKAGDVAEKVRDAFGGDKK